MISSLYMTLIQHFRIEVYKLRRTDFYIFAFLVMAAFIFLPQFQQYFTNLPVKMADLVESAGRIGSTFIVYGLIVALTREFYNNVNRKRILNGYSRQDLFISQVVIVSLYIGFVVMTVLVAIPIQWIFGGESFAAFTEGMAFYKIAGSLLALICYGILGSFLGVITGKPHWAILIYWVWGILEVAGRFLDMYYMTQGRAEVFKYFMPLSIFSQVQAFQLQEVSLLVALVLFLALFQGLSLFKFLKADF